MPALLVSYKSNLWIASD